MGSVGVGSVRVGKSGVLLPGSWGREVYVFRDIISFNFNSKKIKWKITTVLSSNFFFFLTVEHLLQSGHFPHLSKHR